MANKIDSFVIQESYPEPQVLFDIFYDDPQKNADGEITSYRKWHWYGVLRSRVMVTEYRGYLGADKIQGDFTPSNTTTPWETSITSMLNGKTVTGEGTYESYTKGVEKRRINEADFWRVTVTETWRELYINGYKHSGSLS